MLQLRRWNNTLGRCPYSADITGNNLHLLMMHKLLFMQITILLDKAITNLQATTGRGIPATKDFYYGGNPTNG
jgi:hypothetical protein